MWILETCRCLLECLKVAKISIISVLAVALDVDLIGKSSSPVKGLLWVNVKNNLWIKVVAVLVRKRASQTGYLRVACSIHSPPLSCLDKGFRCHMWYNIPAFAINNDIISVLHSRTSCSLQGLETPISCLHNSFQIRLNERKISR
jgi:hypothetical protein